MNQTPKKRCVSSCKQFPKEECNPPRCNYINGTTRKYCRLSSKYIMNKSSCNISRRIKKKEKGSHARAKIGEFLKRTGKILQIVCSNTGECLNFGKKMDEITNLFKGFTGFEYAVDPLTPIGKPSANGFIKEIKFVRNNYISYAVLKSSLTPTADNLVYEYLVGIKFINRVMKRFPCFVQTYGLYFYKTELDHSNMLYNIYNNTAQLNNLELQTNINYVKACQQSKFASILIQHINSAKPISDYMNSYNPTVKHHFVHVLFIIYHTLFSLKTTFTHYDLHDENVLLFQPNPGKYIHYKYHLANNTVIEFYCPYIPKIIDYGRSFFNNGNLNSKKIYDKICATKECKGCGDDVGFTWLDPSPYFGISSQKKNESHDIRLLHMIHTKLKKITTTKPTNHNFTELSVMVNKVVYGVGIPDKDEKPYGTIENTTLHPNRSRVGNITDAYEYLKGIITHPDSIAENNQLLNDPNDKYGTFHIYEDGRTMEFISV